MTLIVAEVGVEHCGDVSKAIRLAFESDCAGADFVKFQMFYRFHKLRHLQFNEAQWCEIFSACDATGIKWFCTPFDVMSVYLLSECKMRTWKIPSNAAVVHDRFLLRQIASDSNNEHTIISTGISGDDDIRRMLEIFKDKKVTLLYCVSKYPCHPDDVHLERMVELRKKFGVPVGFSDHTLSLTLPVEAMRLGATVIEKHVTLDRSDGGMDTCVSLETTEFTEMVKNVREAENGKTR